MHLASIDRQLLVRSSQSYIQRFQHEDHCCCPRLPGHRHCRSSCSPGSGIARGASAALRLRCAARELQVRVSVSHTVSRSQHRLNWFSIFLSHFPFHSLSVETSDGKSHQEEGQLKHLGPDQDALAVRGFYTYLGDDGQTYTVNYVADENGYQPEGAHLPRAVQ